MRNHRIAQGVTLWVLTAALVLGAFPPAAAHAQARPPASGLVVRAEDNRLHVSWQAGVSAASGVADLPQQAYGGYRLPLQTMVVELSGAGQMAAAESIQVQSLRSVAYDGPLTRAAEEVPPALDWEPLPGMEVDREPQLPTAPLFVLHEGTRRGQRLAVLAFSPIYRDPAGGEVRLVEAIDASLAGATPAVDRFADATADPDNAALFAPVPSLADATGPTNPLAARSGVLKVLVDAAGIQEISAAQLSAAGMSTSNPQQLRLFHNGNEVALQVSGSGAGLRVRFYAETVGDRWNTTSVYWLIQDSTNGRRMALHDARPSSAPERTTALEWGRWVDKTGFDSTVAGPDGDNWYSRVSDTQPNAAQAPAAARFDVNLGRRMPAAVLDGLESTLTLSVAVIDARRVRQVATLRQSHRLALTFGGQTVTDSADDWVVNFAQGSGQLFSRTFTFTTSASDLAVTLLPAEQRHRVLTTSIAYAIPVRLEFQNRGQRFAGIAGTWRYSLKATPTGRVLYDVTDPANPRVMVVPDGADFSFQDGPDARRYLLSGPGTLHTPQVVAHTPVSFPSNGAAHTVYIAPAAYHAALQPLVALRRAQNYQVNVVNVEHIYDAWSFGRVDPAAIRNYLRFAVGNYQPAPIAAVLVGDGHWDPKNYLGFDNPNVIPPYLANVDPWLGVTACDTCFAQLDGADPLTEAAFMTDMWVGRFPVNSVNELTGVVNKLVEYETDDNNGALWRSRAAHFVDDYVRPNGSLDGAGNFWASVDKLTAPLRISAEGEQTGFQPESIRITRHYFLGTNAEANLLASDYYKGLNPDRQRDLRDWIAKIKPFATSDLAQTQRRTLDLLNGGIGLATYTGHANHYYYATLYQLPDGFFNLNDVDRLSNRQAPFIMLSMTCYTSQFAKPDPRPTTLDERMFVHPNGGAVAVWGPAGLSVATGHDKLQEGFYQTLWNAPAQSAKLGALVQAGYAVVSASAANLDVNKTFIFLGDPLTAARIGETDAMWLPTVRR